MSKDTKKSGRDRDSLIPSYFYWILSAIVLLILAMPVILTQSYLFGWEIFDLSDKGGIGDTIGGITAPFIGLLSAGLLVWTLFEQIKINKEQKRYNDTSRVLAILSHIQKTDEGVVFLYSTPYALCEGNGLSSLSILNTSKQNEIHIAFEELMMVEKKVAIIQSEISSLLAVVVNSSMEKEDKESYMRIIEDYLTSLKAFYSSIVEKNVCYLFPSIGEMDFNLQEVSFVEKAQQSIQAIESLLVKLT